MIVIIAVGFSSAVAGSLWVFSQQQEKLDKLNTYAANSIAQDVQNQLRLIEGYVYALSGYYAAEREIRPHEFKEFAEKLNIIPAVRSLQFVRFVTRDKLDEYVRGQRAIYGSGYAIFDKLSDASTRPSQPRAEHWPVELAFPLADNKKAIGLDIMTNTSARDAIARSKQTGRISATDSFHLIQNKAEVAFSIYNVVNHPQSGLPAGAVSALVNLQRLIDEVSNSRARILGITEAMSGASIEVSASRANWADPEMRQIIVGDRNWNLLIGLEQQGSPVTAGLLVFGLVSLLTLLALGGLDLADLQKTNRRVGEALSLREESLRDSEAAYSALFYQSPTAKAEFEPDTGKLVRANTALEELTGYPADELFAMTLDQLFGSSEQGRISLVLRELREGNEKSSPFECCLVNKDNKPRWALANIGGYSTEGSNVRRAVLVMQDLTARKQVEEGRNLLVRELAHRLRNTMQLVSSLVEQTGRSAKSSEQFRERLQGRLRALTIAQDALFETNWTPVRLDVLAKRVLEPFQGEAGARRIKVEVAPVIVSAQESQTIALALHELASNAARHGALGDASGRVNLELSLANGGGNGAAQTLNLKWTEESNRVKFAAPETHGFGSVMLEKLLARQHGGEARFDWQNDRMVFSASLPVGEQTN